jgi:hypothetical protein
VTVPLGSTTIQATFAGDAHYQPSNDSATAIVFAFPSGGAFVVGDGTASGGTGTSVTWWADTWSALNALTGGGAPASFKGFAGAVSLPTTTPPVACGGPWTTLPGNSPPPVSGVPSYMGVLVAGQVTKAGNTISGSTVSIVVVQVRPGYAPDPSNHGTGTIVAKFC